jgi:hypothetical protein
LIYLFILGIACIQLTYFFGRSDEHNLRNISGIIVFILFLTIDTIYSLSSRKKAIILATVLFVGGIAANFSSTIIDKVNLSLSKIKSGKLIEPDPVEKQLAMQGNYLKSIDPEKIIVLSVFDSYIIYRLGYRQIGYFSPFYANYSGSQTISFLKDHFKKGYRMIIFQSSPYTFEDEVGPLNNNPAMIRDKVKFILDSKKLSTLELRNLKIFIIMFAPNLNMNA